MRRFRTLYAWYKFGLFLAHEFRWAVIVFWSLVLSGGLLLMLTMSGRDGKPLPYALACYAVFNMIFFQTGIVEFPDKLYLQILFFLFPIVGIGAVADSFARLWYFILTTKQKLPEWQRMIASTMRNHIVVCGVGNVGYRILEKLLTLGEEVVAIEKNGDSHHVIEARDRGVPVIVGEARYRKSLEDANVRNARAVILATDDDSANLDAALTAREIHPEVKLVLRLFDDTLAKLARQLKMATISTASTAAASFVSEATDRGLFQSFQVGGQELHVADLRLAAGSRLAGRTVGEIQSECAVNIVMVHFADGKTAVNPDHSIALRPADHAVIIAPIECVSRLEALNRPGAERARVKE